MAATPDTHGVVTFADGKSRTRPIPASPATATVGYTVCDRARRTGGRSRSAPARGVVKLDVIAADRPPIADPQQLATAEDVALPITLTGSDPDGDPLTFEIVDPPAHGTLIGAAPILAYRPAADYYGPDEFTFRSATDGPGPRSRP